ncbi:MAG: hypothetical protein RMJ98_01475 [Myxococcales bacterium]|nr:hypothetical protein [Myxococcales bacterium]
MSRSTDLLERHQVLCVRGNYERWLLNNSARTSSHAHRLDDPTPASLSYLRRLPATRLLPTATGELLLRYRLGSESTSPATWC